MHEYVQVCRGRSRMFRRGVSYLWSTFGRASYAVCEYKFQPIRKEPRATRTCKAAQPASPFSHRHVRYQGMSISVSLSMTVFARITNAFRSVAHLSDIPTDVDKFSLFPIFLPVLCVAFLLKHRFIFFAILKDFWRIYLRDRAINRKHGDDKTLHAMLITERKVSEAGFYVYECT